MCLIQINDDDDDETIAQQQDTLVRSNGFQRKRSASANVMICMYIVHDGKFPVAIDSNKSRVAWSGSDPARCSDSARVRFFMPWFV